MMVKADRVIMAQTWRLVSAFLNPRPALWVLQRGFVSVWLANVREMAGGVCGVPWLGYYVEAIQ